MFQVQQTDIPSVCVPIGGSEKPGYSREYINQHIIVENGGAFIKTFRSCPDCSTTFDILKRMSVKHENLKCVAERQLISDGKYGEFKYINYKAFYNKCVAFGRGLLECGLKRGDRVGIYSNNSIYWQCLSYGSASVGIAIVPIYDSLGPDAARYIASHSGIKAIFSSDAKLNNSIELCNGKHNISLLVTLGERVVKDGEVDKSVRVMTVGDFENAGRKSKLELDPAKPEDVAVLMYTSGSSGDPKGCILTHDNVVSGAAGFSCLGIYIGPGDILVSFLPLAHIYALVCELIVVAHGAAIAYARGGIENLADDIRTAKPTVIIAVPRVLNRVYEKMKAGIDEKPAFIRKLIYKLIDVKNKATFKNRSQSLLADMFLFKRFRDSLGGRVKAIVNGGAPIMEDVFKFISAVVTPNVIQGYGLTETAASVSVQEVPATNPTTVGAISLSCKVRLRSLKELEYDAEAEFPKGEIQVWGSNVFKGYLNNEELTKEAFDGEWFCTGDVGMITSENHLRIIDRVKQLVKLSQGEYISITSLCDIYAKSKDVAFIYVFASSEHNHPVALVVPTKEKIAEFKSRGISDIKSSEEVQSYFVEKLADTHKEYRLRGFEKIPKVVIDDIEPTVENGLLTPSMKPQFNKIKTLYRDRFMALYN